MTAQNSPWAGVLPATLCPFNDDETLDTGGLYDYFSELASVPGVNGLVCNGHTGEVMSLLPAERVEVTSILAKAVADSGRSVKAISGISAEGSAEAVEHALGAKAAGADGILLMPPHHWLRFGRKSATAIGFFQDVAEGSDIPIVVHQYPAWTKSGYKLEEMLELVKIPQVVCIKMGTREMTRQLYDYQKLKEAAPHIPILTCHDEFLLPSLLEAADGALVGFAGFVPELIVESVTAALNGDYHGAKAAQKKLEPLNRIVYSFGEPGSDAHQRMKCARWLMGRFPNRKMRRPLRDLAEAEVDGIADKLRAAGYETVLDKVSA
jgi:4-hydroxy-tetrahydrodipicolinate synthase